MTLALLAAVGPLAAGEMAVEHARGKIMLTGTVLLVMANGGKLTAFGAGSRFGWIYGELGLTPVVNSATASAHGEAVSFEYILKSRRVHRSRHACGVK
ncbi:hypothetical protein ABLE93_17610 [Xanthobacter sp. KR7-65]|uniref:hypothetical protein n=1 Tax=Xanthobacter sp. KR7-65 TaxID=3156612 RepID=UPI0032B4C248